MNCPKCNSHLRCLVDDGDNTVIWWLFWCNKCETVFKQKGPLVELSELSKV